MTPYEYVLRAWGLGEIFKLEREYGWSLSVCWKVYRAVKSKLRLHNVYQTPSELLRNDGIVQKHAVEIQTTYLDLLKRIEGLGVGNAD